MKQLAIVLVLLAVCGHAATASGQSALFQEQLGDFSRSRLFKTINQMIALQQYTEVDFSPLFQALDDLQADIKASQEAEQRSLDEFYQQFLADSQFYGDQVTQYQTEVAQHEVDLQDLRRSRTALQNTLMELKGQLGGLKQTSGKLQQQMSNNEADTTKKVAEIDSSISIIDQVISKMEQIKESAFAQITAEDLALDTNTLHRRLNAHANVVFEPLTTTLLQMSSQGFADKEAVVNVLKLLLNLRAELVARKQSLIVLADTQKHENEELQGAYEAQIAELSGVAIPGLQGDIDTKDGQIQTKSDLLKDSQSNLSSAQGSLNEANERWAARKEQNKALTQGYDEELLAISQATVALERGGIRRK